MMRQRRRRWLSVRKSASIGIETARWWPVYAPPELLPAWRTRVLPNSSLDLDYVWARTFHRFREGGQVT